MFMWCEWCSIHGTGVREQAVNKDHSQLLWRLLAVSGTAHWSQARNDDSVVMDCDHFRLYWKWVSTLHLEYSSCWLEMLNVQLSGLLRLRNAVLMPTCLTLLWLCVTSSSRRVSTHSLRPWFFRSTKVSCKVVVFHHLFFSCTSVSLLPTLTHSPFSGTPRVSQYQKGKTNLDFTEARDIEWQWNQLDHMQVCTSLQADNHASAPPLSFFYRRDALPAAQPTASKHPCPWIYQSRSKTAVLLK